MRKANLLLALALLGSRPVAAPAQGSAIETIGSGAQASRAPEPAARKVNLLVIPIPISDPASGSGLVLAGVAFYNPNGAPQPWITGGGGIYTSSGTRGIGAMHSMSLADDAFRIKLLGGYFDTRAKFYGIGAAAGNRNEFLRLKERTTLLRIEGQARIAAHFYIGGRYEYKHLDTAPAATIATAGTAPPSPRELRSLLSSLGPVFAYDRRDNALNPRSGEYVSAAWLFNLKGLGSDYAHDRFQLGANLYRPLGSGTTLAARAAACAASSDAPYFDLCKFGASNDLRGYPSDRYRDRASWAVQAELRQHLSGRFGLVAFGGIGGIAPRWGALDDGKLLPAAGGGVRFLVSRSNNVNLRLDYAVGTNSSAVYFGLGEAF